MKKRTDQEFITSSYLNSLKDSRKRKRLFITICSALALIVASTTVMEMIQPAAAVTNTEYVLDCHFDVHQHTDECYKILYDEEGNEIGKELICGQADFVAHQHTEECYKTVFNEETQSEEKVLVCELPEIEPHVHTDSCYEERQVLICEEDHEHDESCYETEKVLICEKPELHTHSESCYDEEGNLVCDKLEVLVHQHTEDCFTEVEVEIPGPEEETVEEPAEEEVINAAGELYSELVTADGETLNFTVTYGADADIPQDADLKVAEIATDDPLFAEYYIQTEGLLDEDSKIQSIRIFDISIVLADGEDEINVEPKALVNVRIEPVGGLEVKEDESITIVHFADEEPEIINNKTTEENNTVTSVSFTTDSFSAYAVVKNDFSENMQNGTIAYFSFDNETDGFADGGARATKVGNTASVGAGQSGAALVLDGSTYLNVTKSNGSPLLSGLDEFTISYWVKTTSGTSDGSHGNWAYYAAPNGNAQEYQREKYIGTSHTNGNLGSERWNNNGARTPSITVNGATPVDAWHHVAVVYRNNRTEVFVDGVSSASLDSGVDLTDLLGNNSIFQIGRANWGSGEGFRGYLDEFSVFNYALSADEINILRGNTGTIALNPMNQDGILTREQSSWPTQIVSSTHYKNFTIDGRLVTGDGDGNPSNLAYSRMYIPVEYNDSGVATITLPSNEQLTSGFTVSASEDVQHTITQDPSKYQWVLKGWYNIATKEYYNVSDGPATALVNQNNLNVFYADWAPANYDYTFENPIETKDTSDFITIKMFDYSEFYNLTSSQAYKPDGDAHFDQARDSLEKEEWYINRTNGQQGDFVQFVDNTDSNHAWQYGTLGNQQGRAGGNWWSNYSGRNPVEGITGGWGSPAATTHVIGDLFSEDNVPGSGVSYLGESNYLFTYNPSIQEYTYDSATNGAVYNQTDQRFYVNSTPTHHYTNSGWDRTAFLPYNVNNENTLRYNDGSTNYWFGMKIELSFWLPDTPGGTDANILEGQPMKFTFRGDDDVWVFIDDKLALDIGGIHEAIFGEINFSNGNILVWYEGDTSTRHEYSLLNSPMNLEAGAHKLSFYYVERGANASNARIQFNLIPRYYRDPDDVNTAKVTKTWTWPDGTPEDVKTALKQKLKFHLETTDGVVVTGSDVTYADGTETDDGKWTYVWEALNPDYDYKVVEDADPHFKVTSEVEEKDKYQYWAVTGYNDDSGFANNTLVLGNGGLNNEGKVLNSSYESDPATIIYEVIPSKEIQIEDQWEVVEYDPQEMHFYLKNKSTGKYLNIDNGEFEDADTYGIHDPASASWFYIGATGDLNSADSAYRIKINQDTGEFEIAHKADASATEEAVDRVHLYSYREIESKVFDYEFDNEYELTDLIVEKLWENGTAPEGASVVVTVKRYKLVKDEEEEPDKFANLRIVDSFTGLDAGETYRATYTVTGPNYERQFSGTGDPFVIDNLPLGTYTVSKSAIPVVGYTADNLTETKQGVLSVENETVTVTFEGTIYTKEVEPEENYKVVVFADDTSNIPYDMDKVSIDGTTYGAWVNAEYPAGTNLIFEAGVPKWSATKVYSYGINNNPLVVFQEGVPVQETFVLDRDLYIRIYGETPYYSDWMDPVPTVTVSETPPTRMLALRGPILRAAAVINLTNDAPNPEIDGYTFVEDATWSATVTLPDETLWKKTLSNLEKMDVDGNVYTYYIDTVVENGMPSRMESKITLDGENKLFVYGDHKDKETANDKLTVENKLATTADIRILKVEKGTQTPLTGASFSIQKYTDETYQQADGDPVTGTVDENGELVIPNLSLGYYQITETVTPEGYIKLGDDPRFMIQQNPSTKEVEVIYSNNNDMVTYDDDQFIIQNEPGAELPYTGGMGTYPYMIFGSILLLGAGILLWQKHRITIE